MSGRQERRAQLRQAVETVAREGVSQRLGIWAIVGATKLILDHLNGHSPRDAGGSDLCRPLRAYGREHPVAEAGRVSQRLQFLLSFVCLSVSARIISSGR